MDVLKEVADKFVESHSDWINKFAVYGTGKYATLLGEAYDNQIIDCYVDESKSGGYFLNKPVIRAFDLVERDISAVIIAASIVNEILIYERIKAICERHGIEIYSIHYGLLTNRVGMDFSKYFNVQDMFGRKYKEIIIDWEDIILYKGIIGENDFFRILERKAGTARNFALIRQHTETMLKGKVEICGLDDVYREIALTTEMDENEIAFIKDTEEKLLLEIYKPNIALVKMLQKLCEDGAKLVVCNSSIYRDELILQMISDVSICDISNIKIISPCDMADRFDCDMNDNAKKLYIDKKCRVNIAMWRLKGNDICIYGYKNDKLIEFAKRAYDLDTRILLSLGYKKIASYFSCRIDNKIENVYDIAYLCIAPVVTAFTIWLANKVVNENFKAVLFAARDGYLLKKLYEYLQVNIRKDLPPSMYLYTSRKASMRAGVCDENDLETLMRFTGRDIVKLKSMLYDLEDNRDDVASFLVLSSLSRKNNFLYLDNTNVDYLQGRYAFFDLISRGTNQFFLQKLFKKKLKGYYLSYRPSSLGVVQSESLYPSMRDEEVFSDNMRNLFESILTSKEASVIGYDDFGKPLFSSNLPSEEKMAYIDTAQRAIMDYFREYCEHYYFKGNINIEYMVLIEWIEKIKENIIVSKNIFKDVDLYDDLWTGHIALSFSKG